jgi:hypothetical protein
MVCQNATSLWWLIPLAGVILALYLLKMRRRDVRVPATFLWPKLTADVRANAPFQKLRPSLLLFLQLLAAALMIFGLANPLLRARGLHGRATVVVLDASASMAATDVSPSRFDAARKRVGAMVETMGGGDQLALIEAGPVTRVVFPLQGDKPKMIAALRDLKPTDAPNHIGEALRLAAALVGQRAEGRIVVLSDGTFPPVQDFSPGKAQLVFEKIGKGSRNLAVTALDAADTQGETMEVFAGIRNTGSAPAKATVTFTVDGEVADARDVSVPARQTLGQTLKAPPTARAVTVSVKSPGDILASDNQATIFPHGAGTVRTLLVTPGNLFLERALTLEPTVRLDKASAVPDYEKAGSRGEGRYDLVIFDGVPVEQVKAPAVWSFGGADASVGVVDLGPSAHPTIVAGKRAHPLLKHVDLDNLLIEKGRRVRPLGAARVLVDGSDGPMLVASDQRGRRTLYAAWSLLDSDFPLQVSFPIFVGNALEWLTGEGRAGGASGGLSVRTGQPFSIASPTGAKTLTLRRPGGRRESLDASSGVAVVRTANTVGTYVVAGPKTTTQVAVNVLNEDESEVAPRATLEISGKAIAAEGASVVLAETWRYLLLAALLVLACEWWVFVKRS